MSNGKTVETAQHPQSSQETDGSLDLGLPAARFPLAGENKEDDSMSNEVIRYLRSQGEAIDPVRGLKIQAHLKAIKRSFRNGLRVDPGPLTGAGWLDTLGNGFLMEDVGHGNPSSGFEHVQEDELLETMGANLAVEMPVPPGMLEASSDASTNIVEKRIEPLQTGGRNLLLILSF